MFSGFRIAMHDSGRVRGGERLGQRYGDIQHSPSGPRLTRQHRAHRAALHEFHRDVRRAVRISDTVDSDDVRVIQARRRAGLFLEPMPVTRVVGDRRLEHLERDLALEPDVSRAIDDAHASRSKERQYLVAGNLLKRRGTVVMRQRLRCVFERWTIEEPVGRGTEANERGELAAQLRVVRARVVEEFVSAGDLAVHRLVVQPLESDASGPRVCQARAVISRRSQALARRQSRITVSDDTCSASAVSSTLRPPK